MNKLLMIIRKTIYIVSICINMYLLQFSQVRHVSWGDLMLYVVHVLYIYYTYTCSVLKKWDGD